MIWAIRWASGKLSHHHSVNNTEIILELVKWITPAIIVLIGWFISFNVFKRTTERELKDIVDDCVKQEQVNLKNQNEFLIIKERQHKLEIKQERAEVKLEQIAVWIGELRQYIQEKK